MGNICSEHSARDNNPNSNMEKNKKGKTQYIHFNLFGCSYSFYFKFISGKKQYQDPEVIRKLVGEIKPVYGNA